jgi:FixJ family two-component response regulator
MEQHPIGKRSISRLSRLTTRQREIVDRVIVGYPDKEIADELGVSANRP